jgi:hypothetical protein
MDTVDDAHTEQYGEQIMRDQRKHWQRIVAIIGSILGLLMPLNTVYAHRSFEELSAQWWQWAFSMPPSTNPLFDGTGDHCMVGQRSDLWFLGGSFIGSVTRTCIIPEGTSLFFPVINSVQFNSPNMCGQDEESISLDALRANTARLIDAVTSKTVTVDDKPIKKVHRIQSNVFEVTLPEENMFTFFAFDVPCPAGSYGPTVDDGYYVLLDPLDVGSHTLHIHTETPSGDTEGTGLTLDVTYILNVVPRNSGESVH